MSKIKIKTIQNSCTGLILFCHKMPQNYFFYATIIGLIFYATNFMPQICHKMPQKVIIFLPQMPQMPQMPQKVIIFLPQSSLPKCATTCHISDII